MNIDLGTVYDGNGNPVGFLEGYTEQYGHLHPAPDVPEQPHPVIDGSYHHDVDGDMAAELH